MLTPKGRSLTNATLLCIVIITNISLQVFCRPTLWAGCLLFICFVNASVYPLLTPATKLFNLAAFINGISLGVFIYCIIFLERINLAGLFLILLFGFGLIAYIPHFFVIQFLIKYVFKPITKQSRNLFLAGFLLFIITACGFIVQYKYALESINRFNYSNYTKLEKSWMTEKIFGMYFKYHNELCEYDGWRPPLHEPALVIGQWMYGKEDPLKLGYSGANLKRRMIMYKKFFPDETIKYDCSCAMEYSENYHNDPVFGE